MLPSVMRFLFTYWGTKDRAIGRIEVDDEKRAIGHAVFVASRITRVQNHSFISYIIPLNLAQMYRQIPKE